MDQRHQSQKFYPPSLRAQELEREEQRQTLKVPLDEHPEHRRRLIMVRGCKLCSVYGWSLPPNNYTTDAVDDRVSRRRA